MVVGDFNGDTNPDIAALYLSPSGFVAILIGNGNGTFQPAANYAVGARAGVLVAEDFTGDQITDLVTGNHDGGISFLRGNSDGTFLPALNSQSFPGTRHGGGRAQRRFAPRSCLQSTPRQAARGLCLATETATSWPDRLSHRKDRGELCMT